MSQKDTWTLEEVLELEAAAEAKGRVEGLKEALTLCETQTTRYLVSSATGCANTIRDRLEELGITVFVPPKKRRDSSCP